MILKTPTWTCITAITGYLDTAAANFRNGGFTNDAERNLVLANLTKTNLSATELAALAKTAPSNKVLSGYIQQLTDMINSGEYTDSMDETKAYELLNSLLADNKVSTGDPSGSPRY
jgi:hypothetical protein